MIKAVHSSCGEQALIVRRGLKAIFTVLPWSALSEGRKPSPAEGECCFRTALKPDSDKRSPVV